MNVTTAQSRRELAALLAARVADDLRRALSCRARAFLAVPGGSTPEPFLTTLGQAKLDWQKVVITLTDERWVPAGSERSNHGLLQRSLFAGAAGAAQFIPLFSEEHSTPDAGVKAVGERLAGAPWPLDVVVLGLGDDMHTASLFPGADRLAAALDPSGATSVLALRAPDALEPRISLTLPALAGASHAYLLIHGPAKRVALDRAMREPPAAAPVRAVAEAQRRLTVYYAD